MPLAHQPGAQNLKDPFDDSKFIVLYPKISAPLRPHQSFFEQWKWLKQMHTADQMARRNVSEHSVNFLILSNLFTFKWCMQLYSMYNY